MDAGHIPVLLHECIDNLNIRPDGIYVDGTLGMGGHSEQIAGRLTTGTLIGIDRDETAIARAGARLAPFGERVQLVHGNFRDTAAILDRLGIDAVDGMLFDLGVSSPQLDETQRGFSYMHDAPLDMRMDATSGLSAWNVVNEWPENELKRILYEYGEERYAPRIAGAIVRARAQRPISTTLELVDVIRSAMPGAALREKQHPAKRSFQAIRIAVNDELAAVREMMDTAPDKLRVGGRLCVISFHSLEDRIVKTGIARREHGCTCPREAPVCTCGFVQTLRSVSRKPILPGEEELECNPQREAARCRARLRKEPIMASPASKKRNTVPMDGNAAYDLHSTAAEEYRYSAPVEMPHAPRTTEAVVPESVPTPKQAIAPLAVLGFAIAAVLIVVSMVARVQLSQASAEVSALEDQYTQLQEQQTRLRIDYESAFNLTEIEDYAIHELGMQKPRSDQLYYISSDATDTAVVLDQNAAEPLSLADRLGDFFSSILEYFR